MPAALKSSEKRLITLGNWHGCALRRALHHRHVNAQEAIQVRSFRLAQIIPRRQLQHAFKRAVINLHHQEADLGRAATIWPSAADPQATSLDRNFEMIA